MCYCFLTPSFLSIRFLPIVHPTPEDTIETLQAKVEKVMKEALEKPPKHLPKPTENIIPATVCNVIIAPLLWCIYSSFFL